MACIKYRRYFDARLIVIVIELQDRRMIVLVIRVAHRREIYRRICPAVADGMREA